MNDARLVRIAHLYLYVNHDDWSYGHLMKDPRSQEITEDEAHPLWTENDMAPSPPWQAGKKDLPFSAWASLHCHQIGLDFDFLDIGANLGMEGIAQATLHKRCGWSNRVYLFEPGEIFSLVRKSVEINRVSDIATVVHAAVTDNESREKFYFLPKASGGSSLLKEKVSSLKEHADIEEIDVHTVTVDGFVSQHMRPAPALIVKIDTEGADFKVLDGMRETLLNRTVIAQIEFIPQLIETYTAPAARLADLVTKFILVNAAPGQQKHIIPMEQIDQFVESTRNAEHPPDLYLIPRQLPNAANLLENILCG
jgi:FkbM family methyltransferase